jgi:peptidyl-tRNA hydrolase
MTPIDMVQPIVVLDQGNHEDVVLAAARASVQAWASAEHDESWERWLAGRFTKTVRNLNPNKAQRVTEVSDLAQSAVNVGEAVAFGFAPCRYADMAPAVRRCQVQGLDRPRSGWSAPTGALIPHMLINPNVTMSTGKTAAQAAHALLSYALRLDAKACGAWLKAGLPVDVSEPADFDQIAAPTVIRDAGFTEVDPGTTTVKLIHPRR